MSHLSPEYDRQIERTLQALRDVPSWSPMRAEADQIISMTVDAARYAVARRETLTAYARRLKISYERAADDFMKRLKQITYDEVEIILSTSPLILVVDVNSEEGNYPVYIFIPLAGHYIIYSSGVLRLEDDPSILMPKLICSRRNALLEPMMVNLNSGEMIEVGETNANMYVETIWGDMLFMKLWREMNQSPQ